MWLFKTRKKVICDTSVSHEEIRARIKAIKDKYPDINARDLTRAVNEPFEIKEDKTVQHSYTRPMTSPEERERRVYVEAEADRQRELIEHKEGIAIIDAIIVTKE